MDTVKKLIIILSVISAVTFLICGWDKLSAKRSAWRVPEAVLLLLSAAGGSLGMLIGMYLFHHKTRKPKFFIGVPVIMIVQITLFSYLYYRGVL